MKAPFEFYFDFSSPYGYFASTQIDALASEFGRETLWRPILLGAIFKKAGSAPLTDMPLKGAYSLHDFSRTASLFDIPYHHPERFPISTVSAARAMWWIERHAGAPKAKEFAHGIYHAYFAGRQDIGELATVVAQAEQIGIDGGQLTQGIEQKEVKDGLRSQVETAIGRGVFGSPFILIDNEPFWGFDRFDYIRKWLLRPAA